MTRRWHDYGRVFSGKTIINTKGDPIERKKMEKNTMHHHPTTNLSGVEIPISMARMKIAE